MFTNVNRPSAVDVLRPFVIGDLFYASSTSNLAALPVGTAGQVLNVAGGVPAWTSTITPPGLVADRIVVTNGAGVLTTPATFTSGQAITLTGATTLYNSALRIVYDPDPTRTLAFGVGAMATGSDFQLNMGAQTADRAATFPVMTGDSIVAVSNATLTAARVPFATTNGILNDSANFTFSTTVCTIANTTAASNATTGAFVVGNGTAATSVATGAGQINAGADITALSGMSVGTGWTPTLAQAPMRMQSSLTDNTICSGADLRVVYTPGAANVNQNKALNAVFTLNATVGTMTAPLALPNAAARSVATVSAGSVTAMSGFTTVVNNAGAGTLAAATGYTVSTFTNTGGGAVTNARGVRIESLGVGTNRYGVDIDAISGGSTNFAIRTQAGVVSIGDTTASSSTTTGALVVGGGIGAAGRVYCVDRVDVVGSGQIFLSLTSAGTTQFNTIVDNATSSVDFNAYKSTGCDYTFTIANSGGSNVTRMLLSLNGNVVLGSQAALATNATDGFAYLPTCAGAPTGVPTAYTGKAASVIDSTNGRIYAYYGGAWHYAVLT